MVACINNSVGGFMGVRGEVGVGGLGGEQCLGEGVKREYSGMEWVKIRGHRLINNAC